MVAGAKLAVAGAVIGVVIAWFGTALMGALLLSVDPRNPLMLQSD